MKGSNNSYVIGLENNYNSKLQLVILLEGLEMLDNEYKGQAKPRFTINPKERKVFNVRIKSNYYGDVTFQFDFV
jgi:hypothetical protein